MNKSVDEFIATAPTEHQELLEMLRTLIFETFPKVNEQYKWSRPVYATEKDFCYLAKAKKYVTLGFYNIQNISDPKGILEGTGKNMRHVKVDKKEKIDKPLFKKMLQQAAEIK